MKNGSGGGTYGEIACHFKTKTLLLGGDVVAVLFPELIGDSGVLFVTDKFYASPAVRP